MRFLFLFIISFLSSVTVFAQKVFTEKLQEPSKNGGLITIVQDDSLTHAVNHGETYFGKSIDFDETDSLLIARSKGVYSKNKTVKKDKENFDKSKQVTGYRVQIYAGSGADGKKNAQMAASKCRKAMPGISVYVKFVQPRWVCHVGDFIKREHADQVANKLRKAKLTSSQVMVVRGQVFRVY